MSEDRAAQVALAIERYVAGLRSELRITGPSQASELSREIGDALVDAARRDPELAFAEMEKLGAPSALAASILAERGVITAGGIPAASWWRLGAAAVIDLVVGSALPLAAVVMFYEVAWRGMFGPDWQFTGPWSRLGSIALSAAVLILAAFATWRTWGPWRTGGDAASPGMALAEVAVVRVGQTRVVVRKSVLAEAGLVTPTRTRVSGAMVLALAVLVLSWSVWMISVGALDPRGDTTVYRLVGPPSTQSGQVESAVTELLRAAQAPAADQVTWPAIDGMLDRSDVEALIKAPGSGGAADEWSIDGDPINIEAGVWTATAVRTGPDGIASRVTMTFGMRADWNLDGDPSVTWVLIGLDPSPWGEVER
jgi:hypothetical protein